MDGVVPVLAQPSGNMDIHAHVEKELQAPSSVRSADVDLLLGEPGGIAEGLLDVLALEVRVPCQHLLEGCSVGNLPHDHRDRDSHPADGSPSAQDLGVKCDPVELHLDTSAGVHSNLPTGSHTLGSAGSRKLLPGEGRLAEEASRRREMNQVSIRVSVRRPKPARCCEWKFRTVKA